MRQIRTAGPVRPFLLVLIFFLSFRPSKFDEMAPCSLRSTGVTQISHYYGAAHFARLSPTVSTALALVNPDAKLPFDNTYRNVNLVASP